jgi:hypothetical protein
VNTPLAGYNLLYLLFNTSSPCCAEVTGTLAAGEDPLARCHEIYQFGAQCGPASGPASSLDVKIHLFHRVIRFGQDLDSCKVF